jgi:poly(A) polymerase/tRNA nucleotidyltransferase (CCA-adding enzyme)
VRDLVLGRYSADLDVAISGDAVELARSFADATGGSWVLLDTETGSARIVWPESNARSWPRVLDLVRLRAATIEADLRLRDFTINAMALALDDVAYATPAHLIDPLGGATDLRQGLLRATGPRAIVDDPLRMLRAARLAGTLGLRIADELAGEIAARHELIARVSVERVRDELLKLLALPAAGRWVRWLDETGLLTTLIPELEPARACEQPLVHFLPVLDHLLEAVVAADWLLHRIDVAAGVPEPSPTTAARPLALDSFPELDAPLPHAGRLRVRFGELVDGVPRVALFKLAVLLHDVAKPQTKAIKPDGGVSFYDHQTIGAEVAWQIARRLRISRAGCEYVRLVVREHMRPGQLNELGAELTPRAVYRFFRATGDAGPDVLLHSLCDHLAMKGPLVAPAGWEWHAGWTARMLEMFYDETEHLRPEPLIRGDDLMRELGLKPGRVIGQVLDEIREAQVSGDVRTREEALDRARCFLERGPVSG